jgi:hypothetical protein
MISSTTAQRQSRVHKPAPAKRSSCLQAPKSESEPNADVAIGFSPQQDAFTTARASDLQPLEVAIDRLADRGRRVAPGLRRSTCSFQLWHAKSRPIVDALEPWLGGKLGLISQKTRLAEASAMLCQREWLALFVGDGGIELLEAPLS